VGISPKVKALLFFLGGGVIPTVHSLLNPRRLDIIMPLYVTSFLLTAFSILLALSIYAFIVGFKRIQDSSPNEGLIRNAIEALPLVVVMFSYGIPRFEEEANKYRSDLRSRKTMQSSLENQRDTVYTFLLGFVGGLAAQHAKGATGVTEFKDFVERYLYLFLSLFFEKSPLLNSYRASVYLWNEEKEELQYLLGVSPEAESHSRVSLPLDSLAGWALRHPEQPYYYPHREGQAPFTFHPREEARRYKSIMACAVRPSMGDGQESEADMVLCIDCTHDWPKDSFDHLNKMILAITLLLTRARVLLNIDKSALKENLH
jgi:hypothetical protein